MIIIGIDVGFDGGITTMIENQSGDFSTSTCIMPVIKGEFGAKKGKEQLKRKLNEAVLKEMFDEYARYDCRLYIEKQHAMTKQGVSSVFSLAYQFGFLIGLATRCNFKINIVGAKEWQKILGVFPKGESKKASIDFATLLLPGVDLTKSARSQKIHDGMTDSVCIAEYGREQIYGRVSN